MQDTAGRAYLAGILESGARAGIDQSILRNVGNLAAEAARMRSLGSALEEIARKYRETEEALIRGITGAASGAGGSVGESNDSSSQRGTDKRSWFRKFADAHGFRGVRFHDLRHTHASILLANNIDVVAVARRLGHEDPSVTLRICAHALARRDVEAAQALDRLFGDIELPHAPELHMLE